MFSRRRYGRIPFSIPSSKIAFPLNQQTRRMIRYGEIRYRSRLIAETFPLKAVLRPSLKIAHVAGRPAVILYRANSEEDDDFGCEWRPRRADRSFVPTRAPIIQPMTKRITPIKLPKCPVAMEPTMPTNIPTPAISPPKTSMSTLIRTAPFRFCPSLLLGEEMYLMASVCVARSSSQEGTEFVRV